MIAYLKNNNKRGFTIIELIVVIAIIAVLAGIVISSVNIYTAKARDAKRMADLRQISKALELYKIDNGQYPSTAGICAGNWCCSYSVANWNTFGAMMTNYVKLSNDPTNNGYPPWDNIKYYTYCYRSDSGAKYDLVANLEDTSSPYRCEIRHYLFYVTNTTWQPNTCTTGCNQLYSPQQ
jgi:type II secretion system protein G